MKKNKEKSAKEKCKIYEDYDWITLCKDGTLKKLKVIELEKYLAYHDIKLPKNKQQNSDKVDIIKAHVGRNIYDQMITSADLGQNNLNYSNTDSDESSHSVDSVIVGAHSCLDSDASDSETSESSDTGSSDDDYNVKELGDSRVISKVNDVPISSQILSSKETNSFTDLSISSKRASLIL